MLPHARDFTRESKIQAKQGRHTYKTPRPFQRVQRAQAAVSLDAELIKCALLPPRLFRASPDLPDLRRLFAPAYRENRRAVWTEAALADGAGVRSDANEATAGGEHVPRDRVGVQ